VNVVNHIPQPVLLVGNYETSSTCHENLKLQYRKPDPEFSSDPEFS
jgi:hypothetical protein